MEIDEWAVGQRVAGHRVRRGLTQAELAGLVGISLSMMKKIESGDRLVTRFSQLVQFAQALRITDLRELTGVPLALLPDGRRGHAAADGVYAAVMQRHPPVGEVPRLRLLARRVETAWEAWQAASSFRYDMVGQALPGLITEVEAALWQSTGDERRAVLRLASTLYQLIRTWTKRVGEYELSLVAADRAVTYALDADDPDLAGSSAWNLAMILSAQGRTGQARAVLYRAIEELKPRLEGGDPARLAVFGGLHLLAATEAAREDHTAETHRLLQVADSIAARTGETNHHRMVFGPTNVALHRVSTAVELGRTAEALEITGQVATGSGPNVPPRAGRAWSAPPPSWRPSSSSRPPGGRAARASALTGSCTDPCIHCRNAVHRMVRVAVRAAYVPVVAVAGCCAGRPAAMMPAPSGHSTGSAPAS